ncbi:10030_t:CDS:2 [Diversispora eburnea]|uniref:10030_t:CDS:1 n=1 Tax=Diversispora eburnea TaxID=1213867 RepID=A0A9N9CN13_9GLOM|nr:10030_t:CDS:2 [Diversispora eburnea]
MCLGTSSAIEVMKKISIPNIEYFAYGRAWDTYCLGEIMKVIYSVSNINAELSLLSTHTSESPSSEEETNQAADKKKATPLRLAKADIDAILFAEDLKAGMKKRLKHITI